MEVVAWIIIAALIAYYLLPWALVFMLSPILIPVAMIVQAVRDKRAGRKRIGR